MKFYVAIGTYCTVATPVFFTLIFQHFSSIFFISYLSIFNNVKNAKMSSNLTERLIFEAEWYDKVASTLKKFYLYYFPADNTVELFDLKTRKTFLRRTKCEGIEVKDLYVGGVVNVFSRALKITDTADNATRNRLATTMQKTFGMIKPVAMDKMGEILRQAADHNFHISNIKMVKLSEEQIEDLCKIWENPSVHYVKKELTTGPLLAMELLGENAIDRWRELMGLDNCQKSSGDAVKNPIHGSDNQEQAEKEIEFFFPDVKSKKKGPRNTATLKNCTCCLIKPHAVQARLTGPIIESIQRARFKITAIQQFHVDPINAEEFLEVYKGVLPEYSAMVAELQSGPCVALEITHSIEGVDVHAEFRKFCGPMDPDMARQIRPETLRAKYGKTKVQNAVHCSDLPEDSILEVEYFFKILSD